MQEKLIERILFLEGIPVVSKLNTIRIGLDIPSSWPMIWSRKWWPSRITARPSRWRWRWVTIPQELLEGILKDEDGHVNAIEEKQDQIEQMGIQQFLAIQAGE